jgi:secondary thiamine-phosphate synthase enzyme
MQYTPTKNNHMIQRFVIQTSAKKEVLDITAKINILLSRQDTSSGICTLFVAHTTAGIAINEAGEGTAEDLLEVMEKAVPKIHFRHEHDPSHAWSHMAASLTGTSIAIPFEEKRLILGTWQSVLLLEFDGPKERTLIVSING